MSRIYKRGDAYWGDFQALDGRRVRLSLRTQDRVVAKERLRAAELAAADPRAGEQPRPLSAALDYLIAVACNDRSAATRSFYEQKARHLIRVLGDVAIESIDRAAVAAYAKTRIDEGAHPHTVGKELIALRRALKEQHEIRPLPRPPGEVMITWRSHYQPITRYHTPEQFAALLQAAPPARQLWIVIAVYTGGNLSEVTKIDRTHVDLAAGTLRIPGTKRQARNRLQPIAEPLRPWLAAHLEAHRDPATGAVRPGPIVGPWRNATRDLAQYCARAGVPRVTTNDLRRTYASWLKQAGVDSSAVAALMGHTSTRMVDLVYGKLAPATLRAAVAHLPAVPPVGGEQLALPAPPAPAADEIDALAGELRVLAAAALELGAVGRAGEMASRSTDWHCDAGVSEPGGFEPGEVASPASPPRRRPRKRPTPHRSRVPRDGVEPPTRGFSGRVSALPIRGIAA